MPPPLIANAHDEASFELSRLVETEYYTPNQAWAEVYEPRMSRSGMRLQFYTVGGDLPEFCGDSDLTQGTYRRLATVHEAVRGTDVAIVRSGSDLAAVERGERRGLVITMEGAQPIGGQGLATLHNFFALGLRSIILNSYIANQVGDGVGERRGAGLTNFGCQVVRELNELGVLIDVTQASSRCLAEVIELSETPVLASHSNASAIHGHIRNLSDDQLRGIALRGGVIGMSTFPAHVGSGRVTIDDFLRHIDHTVSLVGPEHVCLGLNIVPGSRESNERFYRHTGVDRTDLWLPGFEDIDRVSDLLEAMRRSGYDDRAISEVCGLSLLRLLKRVLPDG